MIINRYTAKWFFRYFLMIIGVVVSLFIVIEYLTNAGKFARYDMSLFEALSYVLLKAPYVFWLVTPVGCIIGPIVFFGLMKRNNELVALQSGGMSLFSVFRPVAACGIILGILVFIVAETVVPKTITRAYAIQRFLRNKTAATTRDTNIWLRNGRDIINIGNYNAEKKTLTDVTLYGMDKEFRLIRRVDAQSARYENGGWILMKVLEMRLDNRTGDYTSTFHAEKKENIQVAPKDLKRVLKYSEEMNIIELYRYVKLVESEGYELGRYKVDLYSKTAVPFTCLFMALMGTGIVFARQKKDAIPSNVALGTLAAFLFWFFNSFCVSLGYASLLPAALAAWLANLLFMCACGIVLIKAE
jgi:lipopolysaccharide export system permease protein